MAGKTAAGSSGMQERAEGRPALPLDPCCVWAAQGRGSSSRSDPDDTVEESSHRTSTLGKWGCEPGNGPGYKSDWKRTMFPIIVLRPTLEHILCQHQINSTQYC